MFDMGAWQAVEHHRPTAEELTAKLAERGTFDRADEVYDALARGEVPEGYAEVDLDELRRRHG